MSSTFIFYTLAFSLGFLIRSLFSHLFMIGTYVKYMQDIEKKFLLLSAYFVQWKVQSLKILELTYQHRVKHSSEELEDFKAIKSKIEEKFDSISNQYVKDMKVILPYKTNYENFKEAVNYVEKLIKESKGR